MDGTKRCTRCGETKGLAAFNRWSRSQDGRQPHCRDCSKAYYRANRERHIRNVQRWKARYRLEIRAKLIQYLRAHPCVDCGETDIRVLEFDHIRGEKEYGIAGTLRQGYSWDTILQEIAKCEVRCANCHARRTAEVGNYYTTRPAEILAAYRTMSQQLELEI